MRTDRFTILILMMVALELPSITAAQEKSGDPPQTTEATLEVQKTTVTPVTKDAAQPKQILDVEMTTIEGAKVNLKKYTGNVVLVVNVASKCGFTGQYRPLQALHEKYSAKGLRVVAFPCNQFGNQEPKDEADINAFCKNRFGIKFDIFSKIDVKGKNQALLFKNLTGEKLGPVGTGDIKWNFEKFLIGKDGKPIARFASNVAPDNKVIVARIESALGIQDQDAKAKENAKANTKATKTEQKPQPKTGPRKNRAEQAPAPDAPDTSSPSLLEPPV